MNPSACPDQQQLVAYVNGALSLETADAIAEHLEQCASCEQAVAALERQPGALAAELRGMPGRAPTVSRLDSPMPAGKDAPLEPTTYSATEGPGTCIGPYKLLQQLGQGGMGTVFMAEQEQPVKRRVALKIIKPGMDSAQVIARFEQERQALAMMDHPNIAKVLDAGTTEAGRPFFVMELVKGISITKFCDHEHLTPRERLELFIPVCHAVQHAHQKGIIHRDLKPSNVLIALYDGKPIPKVIDFGVAKATAQKLTERTMFTEVGQMIGTVEYMAPEQAELNNLDIDTRADIYSLGVILYELLTGSPPFSRKQLQSAAFTEMLRIIREVEPPKPSTKLSSSDELPSIAAHRKLEPKRLTKLVHGDLDWIAMKCLEKDRSRRYETANGLASDIQRYLDNEPVLAGAPSAGYRLKKLLRRNKKPVLAVALVFLALVGGIAGTTWGLVEANHALRQAEFERDEKDKALNLAEERRTEAETARQAEADQRQTAEAAGERAKEQRKQADAVANYLVETFRRPDPAFDGRKITVAETLSRAVASLRDDQTVDPLTRAKLLSAIGQSYVGLGLIPEALEVAEQRLVIYEENCGHDHPDTLASMRNKAVVLLHAMQASKALPILEETLQRMHETLGPDHPETLECMNCLGTAYGELGETHKAGPLLEETVKLARTKLGWDHRTTIGATNNLAGVYLHMGQVERGLSLLVEALNASREKLGSAHPTTLNMTSNLAYTYQIVGQLDKALPLMEIVVTLERDKLGPDHPKTLDGMVGLANALVKAGNYEEGEKYLRECLELFRRTMADDWRTFGTEAKLGSVLVKLQQYEEAERLLLEGYDGLNVRENQIPALMKKKPLVNALKSIVELYDAWDKHAEAEKWWKELEARQMAEHEP